MARPASLQHTSLVQPAFSSPHSPKCRPAQQEFPWQKLRPETTSGPGEMSSGRAPRRLSDPITMQEVRGARTIIKNQKKRRKLKKGKTVPVPEPADADEGIADVEAIPMREIPTIKKETQRVKKVKEERKNEVEKNFDVKVTNENEKSAKKKKSRRREEKSINESNQGEMNKSKDENEEKSRNKTDGNKAESKSIKEKLPRKSSFKQKSFDEDVPDGVSQSIHRKSVTISTKGDETILITPNESSTEEEEEELHGILKNKNQQIETSNSNDSSNSRRPCLDRSDSNDSNNSSRGGQPEVSKRDSMRSIASSYMSDVDDDDDGMSWLKNLLVIKILFVDIFCSMGDHISDFMQGFNLMFDFSQLTSLCHYWRKESWSYGVLILAINWSPGLVAAFHLLAYHRKEVAAEDTDEPDGTQIHKGGIKTTHDEKSSINVIVTTSKSDEEKMKKKSRRWKKFLLQILLCLFFYPIVPALAYFKMLWWWNVRDLSSVSFQRAEKTAHLAHSITGGFEAPVQLILTLWLIMRGVFDNPISTVVKGELPKDRFGNNIPLPAIPLLSIVFSIFSIILASIRINKEEIPLPRGAKISKQDWFRLALTPALSKIPFFLCSILFKISSFAFQWIFLDYTALVPNLVNWFFNLCIGYYYYSESKLPKKYRKKIREAYQKKHPGKGENEHRTEQAVWLNSFIGLFLPCCYSQNLGRDIVENMKAKDYEKIIKRNKKKQNKILRCQQLFGTLIHLVVILAIWILVNFEGVYTRDNGEPGYAYNDNKFTQNSFNIFCLTMLISGIMNLGFCFKFDILDMFHMSNTIDYQAICKERSEGERSKIFKEKKNWLKQICIILIGILVVVLPFVIGYGFNALLPQDNGFIIIRPNAKAPNDQMRIDITKMFSVNKIAEFYKNEITGTAQTCRNLHANSYAKKCPSSDDTILIVDFKDDKSCYENKYETIEKLANSSLNALILLEDWGNRSTSPYKRKIGETVVDFNDERIPFPIVTVRNPDVLKIFKDLTKNQDENYINCKSITIVFTDLEQQLNKETSPLFHVDCGLGNRDVKVAWKDYKEKCPNNKNHIFFAQVEEETAPVRCIDVTIRCYDKGLICNELVRYQGKWDDKQERKENSLKICEDLKKSISKKSCNSTQAYHFNENMPLVCNGRGINHAPEDLLCHDVNYIKDETTFWRWDRDWNHSPATNWCCDDDKKIIKFSDGCRKDITKIFGKAQEKGWSQITNSTSDCTFNDQGNTLSQYSYRFNRFNLNFKTCILIERTQKWCLTNTNGDRSDVTREDEYKNHCEDKIGEYKNVEDCKKLIT